jgi:hypothetical protein
MITHDHGRPAAGTLDIAGQDVTVSQFARQHTPLKIEDPPLLLSLSNHLNPPDRHLPED